MTLALASFRESLLAVWRAARTPGPYAVLLLSLGLWAIAYQHKSAYTVDVGGLQDDAYVAGFNTKEHNPALNYRWSGQSSSVTFPGIGNQPVVLSIATIGFRPCGSPPLLTVSARGRAFVVQTQSGLHTDRFALGRGDPWDGDLKVTLSSPTYSPADCGGSTDQRQLGVIVDSITVAPADYALRPTVVPPLGTMGGLLAGMVLCYLSALVTIRRRLYALLFAAALCLAATALIIFARPELGLLAGQLPALCAWGLLVALVSRAILDAIIEPGRWSKFAIAAGSAAFAAAFLIRFGGLMYPQFLTSDIGLHIHNAQKVALYSQWVWTGQLPDGTPVPYPPALYVLLAPLTWLFGNSDEAIANLLKWTAALLDSLSCLGLAWAGSHLWPGRAGGVAALAYALSPAPFPLFSAGNYSNLFAQSVFSLTLLGALVCVDRRPMTDDRRRTDDRRYANSRITFRASSVVLTLGFGLTMLGHYGMMLAALAIMGLFGLWTAVQTLRGSRQSAAWALLSGFGAALAAGFALYYWRFVGEMWGQLSGALSRVSGIGSTVASQAVGTRVAAGEVLAKLAQRAENLVGALPGLSALFGVGFVASINRPTRALLFAWLGACVMFALLDQTLGDAVRWYYLAAAGVSLLAGRYLALLLARGRMPRILTGLCLSVMLWQLLYTWVGDLIFTRYH